MESRVIVISAGKSLSAACPCQMPLQQRMDEKCDYHNMIDTKTKEQWLRFFTSFPRVLITTYDISHGGDLWRGREGNSTCGSICGVCIIFSLHGFMRACIDDSLHVDTYCCFYESTSICILSSLWYIIENAWTHFIRYIKQKVYCFNNALIKPSWRFQCLVLVITVGEVLITLPGPFVGCNCCVLCLIVLR